MIDIKVSYDSEPIENRRKYREECRHIFEKLYEQYHVDAIVTANDNYYWVREFIEVGHDNDVPTVLLDKEGFVTNYTFETEAERFKKLHPFMCDHVFVWSERQRQYWRKNGVAEKDISVIGQPRSDLFFIEKRNEVDNLFPSIHPLVTFFSYQDDACIPIEVILKEHLTWAEMKGQTHDEFYELAKQFPEYNFVIKTHPQQLDLALLQEKYHLNNLRVVGGSSLANELIQRSELIVAFQTTVIIEAMFMNKRVIYTCWDKHIPRFQQDIFPFHKADGIVQANTLDKFRSVCRRCLEGDLRDFKFTESQLQARDSFVSNYLYKPDGHVGERFFTKMNELVGCLNH